MKYIAFEGRDGVGKTTLAKEFAKLTGSKYEYEPCGESFITSKLREFCLDSAHRDEVNWKAREFMMLANRAISTKRVHDLLLKGEKVVSDRSLVSGMVYAKVASDMYFDEWWDIGSKAFWTIPDQIIYVDIDKTSINKVKGDIYDDESDHFHSEIRKQFPLALDFFKENEDLNYFIFKNDFSKTPRENAEKLLKELNDGK